MRMYTTCFNKLADLPDNIVPISISRYPPKNYKGLQYMRLAPTPDNLVEFKEVGSRLNFTSRFFLETLSNLDVKKVINDLTDLVADNSSAIALVCYESPNSFCHRKLVAEWLSDAGITITEYT